MDVNSANNVPSDEPFRSPASPEINMISIAKIYFAYVSCC